MAESQSAVPAGCVRVFGDGGDINVGHGNGALSCHVGCVWVWRRHGVDQCPVNPAPGPPHCRPILTRHRSICFNASNVYFILSQRLADVVGPILLASGLEPRALMQVAPAFISLSLILLPTGIERLSDIRMAGIR